MGFLLREHRIVRQPDGSDLIPFVEYRGCLFIALIKLLAVVAIQK